MKARRRPTILDAVRDANLFAPWFRKPESWSAWFAFLVALFALPMTDDQFDTFQQCTGRDAAPIAPATEGWLRKKLRPCTLCRVLGDVQGLPATPRAWRTRDGIGHRV